MDLGWIDFSKAERNKVLNVLDLLGENGVLDELGIATIRDGFSDLLFPGTSTIQTRAKYFLIVPYALKDLEKLNETNPLKLLDLLDKKEEECSIKLYDDNPQELGIIGRNAILQKSWVKRPPSNIYLAGLRTYGILNLKSFTHYVKFISSQNQEKREVISLGNNSDKSEGSQDDENVVFNQFSDILNVPTYKNDWFEDLKMDLTYDEGQFLKNQIVTNCKDSMLAFILNEKWTEFLEFDSIRDLNSIIDVFPEEIQRDYKLAIDFSEFVFALRVIYNVIVSEGNNNKANENLRIIEKNLDKISDINFNYIMFHLNVKNPQLKQFLDSSKKFMQDGDMKGLKNLIVKREIHLKGRNRARLCHPGEFDYNFWFAGDRLEYRFANVRTIVGDIFKSEGVI